MAQSFASPKCPCCLSILTTPLTLLFCFLFQEKLIPLSRCLTTLKLDGDLLMIIVLNIHQTLRHQESAMVALVLFGHILKKIEFIQLESLILDVDRYFHVNMTVILHLVTLKNLQHSIVVSTHCTVALLQVSFFGYIKHITLGKSKVLELIHEMKCNRKNLLINYKLIATSSIFTTKIKSL